MLCVCPLMKSARHAIDYDHRSGRMTNNMHPIIITASKMAINSTGSRPLVMITMIGIKSGG